MKEGLFRQEALDYLNAPEPLDEPIEIAPLYGWLAWLGLALLAGCVFIAACFVRIPVTVHGHGLLAQESRAARTAPRPSLKAVLRVPLERGEHVKPGMLAHITPDGIAPELYGFLEGRVLRINSSPIGDSSHQKQIVVDIGLLPDPQNEGGFRWTLQRKNAPTLAANMPCSGTVTLTECHPLDLLRPTQARN